MTGRGWLAWTCAVLMIALVISRWEVYELYRLNDKLWEHNRQLTEIKNEAMKLVDSVENDLRRINRGGR